jgi:hypothetical protein
LTAALGLYHNLKLPLPTEGPSWFREEYILVTKKNKKKYFTYVNNLIQSFFFYFL